MYCVCERARAGGEAEEEQGAAGSRHHQARQSNGRRACTVVLLLLVTRSNFLPILAPISPDMAPSHDELAMSTRD